MLMPADADFQDVIAITQAMEAARQLQGNLAAEAAVITSVSQMYGAAVTPHQNVYGALAAWPQVVYMSRIVRYLGALCTTCRHTCAAR